MYQVTSCALSQTHKMSFSLLAQESTERDEQADDGKEHEGDRCNALHRKRVSDVTPVVRVAVLDVFNESTE